MPCAETRMTALFFDGFATTWHGDSREESEPIGLSTNEIGKIVVDVARKGSGVGRALQDSTPEARDRRLRQCRLLATSLGRKTGRRRAAGADSESGAADGTGTPYTTPAPVSQ